VQWAVRARRQGLADEGLADQALDAGRRMRKELRTQGETMKPQLERWLAELQTSPAGRGKIMQPLPPPSPAPVPAADDDDASASVPSAHGDHSTPPPAADGEKATGVGSSASLHWCSEP
jgi:hypothetical protein